MYESVKTKGFELVHNTESLKRSLDLRSLKYSTKLKMNNIEILG